MREPRAAFNGAQSRAHSLCDARALGRRGLTAGNGGQNGRQHLPAILDRAQR
jgi:hypothetical protein